MFESPVELSGEFDTTSAFSKWQYATFFFRDVVVTAINVGMSIRGEEAEEEVEDITTTTTALLDSSSNPEEVVVVVVEEVVMIMKNKYTFSKVVC